MLRVDADEAERNSRLTGTTAKALRDAGLFRLGVPKSHGGYEAAPLTFLDVSAEVAQACPSSAWVLMVSYVAQQMAASFGDQAREELWGDGPDTPMCGVFARVGVEATPADDGLTVSGRWAWASGCHHADWAIIGVPSVDGATPEPAVALVPVSDLSIVETWDMTGLRGTGSHTLVADRLFVPRHRIRTFAKLVDGNADATSPLYRIPPGSMTVTSAGPMLGATRAIFRQVLELIESGKPLAMSVYRRAGDSPSIQAALADAATLIDTADLHLSRSASWLMSAAAGEGLGLPERARLRMDTGYAVSKLRESAQLLFTVAGAGSLGRASVIARNWRDLETGARHPTLAPGLAREMYGRVLAGDRQPVSAML
ncbi:acyl-CoA dehydrogenase family protein [Micromonospora zamorensis]|uniref:acyl-CoA dehydrogenase family protein n=1 Tax=Micromonospora zamorensis TaxID=709883 RepID=UPI003CF380D0